jgi:hypothetical protein
MYQVDHVSHGLRKDMGNLSHGGTYRTGVFIFDEFAGGGDFVEPPKFVKNSEFQPRTSLKPFLGLDELEFVDKLDDRCEEAGVDWPGSGDDIRSI